LSLSPNPGQLHLSSIQDLLHPFPIRDQPQKSSPIKEQLRRFPPWTQSTPLPAPNLTQAKATKNVCGKSHLQQRKMSSKATKGKKPLKKSANLNLLTAMIHANPKFVTGKLMLTVDALRKAGKSCVELHNYYINNYNKGEDIIVSYKDQQFLVGDDIFLISWSNLCDLFNLDALDVRLMR
jgi:hypothetical protein